ncbi:outer envelope protein 39, chloroplastic-like isoform X3 [Musa acuminata AAA Group]
MTYRYIGSIVPYRLNPTRGEDIILALAAGRLGLVVNAHPRKRFHIPLTSAHEKHPETPNKSAAGSHRLRSLSRSLRLPPPLLLPSPVFFPAKNATAKIDFNVDLTQKLCGALLFPHIRQSSNPFSQVIARLSIKHPNLFGRNEKLDVLWDKGIDDFNILIAFRRPRPDWLSQQSFTIQHSVAPEIAVHGLPVDHFTRSGSGGVNLSRSSVGVDFSEPSTSHWSSKTSIKFEHVRPLNNDGHTINRDMDGFPITSSGRSYDNMIVLKQESQYAIANDDRFTKFNFQMEQGLPLLSKWLIFNRFKIVASKGFKLGPTFLVTSLTGGSIVGDMAPYQAFALGGIGSVRGYGEGAIGSGRTCLVANGEFTIPVTKELEGAIFMDCGTDLGSAR